MRAFRELFDLKGQVAIVTGGATGIGIQMAYVLAEAGADLVIASRKLENCTQMAQQMEKDLAVRVLPVALDVTNPASIDALYEAVMKAFGRVDILVNNSGATWGAPSLEYPLKGWNKVMETNLTGAWLMAQKAGQIMAKQRYGRIINISSITAFTGMPAEHMDAVAYNASKAALAGLTKDLALKWAEHNITVNALAPGWFPTKMSQYAIDQSGDGVLQCIPLKRYGADDELKTATLFLAAPGSGYVTGAIVPVDGGWLAK